MELVRNLDEKVIDGIAILKDGDYEFPCPVCDSDVEVDDFGPAYRCGECHCAIRFREENIIKVGGVTHAS